MDTEMILDLNVVPMNKYLYIFRFILTDDGVNNSRALYHLGRGDRKSLVGDRRACDHFTQHDSLNDSLVGMACTAVSCLLSG